MKMYKYKLFSTFIKNVLGLWYRILTAFKFYALIGENCSLLLRNDFLPSCYIPYEEVCGSLPI